MRAVDLRMLRRRVRVAQVLLAVAFLALAARAAHLALVDERGAQRGANQLVAGFRLPPERGRILDSEGDELALTVAAPSVYAIPGAIEDPERTARQLARALGADSGRVRRRLEHHGPFVFVQRWIDAARAERVGQLDLDGVGLLREPRRAYPHGSLAGSIVGFANIDGVGVRGIEQRENDWLFGRPQQVRVERDARGRLLLGPGFDRHASAGGDVLLTVDAPLQAEAEAALEETLAETGARGGVVISLDPATGDVLALAEHPAFDPNRFRSVAYPETRSRAFLDGVEPGSTLKPFLVAAALDAGIVRPDEVFDLEGGIRVPGKWIRDLHPRPSLDLGGILRVSSNVGAVHVAQRLGMRATYDALRRLGFGATTGSGFPEESAGILRSWERWKPLDHATIAFGQGLSVTPVQLAAATAALGAGGIWRSPRIVRARRAPGGQWQRIPLEPGRRALSAQAAATVVRMLEQVVSSEGTGRRAGLAGVRVAGKTGTAQKLDRETGTYSNERYFAWFVGLAPAESPRLAVVVGLDEPQGGTHGGGAVAAPLFARVAAAHLTHLGIPTEPAPIPARPNRSEGSERVQEIASRVVEPKPQTPDAPLQWNAAGSGSASPSAEARPVPQMVRYGDRILLPDFHGLSLDQVRRITADVPLIVEFQGSGHAVAQEPEPGTIVADGQRVRVRFERQRDDVAWERRG